MAFKQALVLLMSAWLVVGQRPSFSGLRPIGYPEVATTSDPLGNRFGEDTPLPAEANGDRALVERLSRLPVEQQPFWFINWQALEANRKNPQTYPHRENSFTNNVQAGGSSQSANFQSNPSNTQSNSGATSNSNGLTSKFGENNNSVTSSGSLGNYPSTGSGGNYPSTGSFGNYPSTGSSSNYPSTGSSSNYPSTGSSSNYPSTGSSSNYPSTGSSSNYPSSGPGGNYENNNYNKPTHHGYRPSYNRN